MANVKFTEFPSAATVGSTDIIPIVQGGTNKKATAAVFSTYIGSAFVALTGNQTIAGVKTFSSQLASSVATGTAPFSIASTTKVTNLNADLLDGYTSADFQLALTNPVTGTGTTNYLPKFTGTSALGDSLIYDNGTNVGIGTTSPAAKLSVLSGTGTISQFNTFSGADTSVALQLGGFDTIYPATGAHIRAYVNHGSTTASALAFEVNGTSEKMRITSAGNVGIGTTSPSNLLSVSNNNLAVISLDWAGDNNAKSKWSANHSTGEVQFYNYTNYFPTFYANGSEKMRITLAGNVLIGTTTDAGYKLDVNGTARVSGVLTANANILVDDGTNGRLTIANASGQNDIYSTTTAFGAYKTLRITGSQFIYRDGNYSTDILTIASGGAATFSSSVTTGGQVLVNTGTANQNTKIFGNKVGMSRTSDGAEVVYFSKNTDLGAEGTANINGYNGIQFRTQGAESVKVTIKENGNLLVNKTTDVGYKLDVFGTTRLDPQSGEYGLVVGRASGMVNIKAGSDDGGYLLMDSAGEGGMVGLNWYSSENVILANGGGKVGIGNSSPTQKLTIGDGTGTGNQYVRVNASASDIYIGQSGGTLFGQSANSAGFVLSDNTSYPFVLGTIAGQSLIFGTNNTERMRILPGGEVAINTTSPDASAAVQIDSNAQGFLVPRMLESEINSISSPAEGLLVYNTDQHHMCMYDGSVWKKFSMSNM